MADKGSSDSACALATPLQAASASDTPSTRSRPSTMRRFQLSTLSLNSLARTTSPLSAHASRTVSSMRVCATRGGYHSVPISSLYPSIFSGTSPLRHLPAAAT